MFNYFNNELSFKRFKLLQSIVLTKKNDKTCIKN